MNEQPRGNEDHRDRFNLLNEDLRGAMYRGGAERDNVITGHVLSVVAIAVFVGGMVLLGTFLNALGVNLGDLIASMARDMPLLLLVLIGITFVGCTLAVLKMYQRLGG